MYIEDVSKGNIHVVCHVNIMYRYVKTVVRLELCTDMTGHYA